MTAAALAALLAATLLAACEPGPAEIAYGKDECAACRMRITDARFASELVTRTGKVFTFDAVECLLGFAERESLAEDEVHSRWVADFANPGRLIDARSARWLRTGTVRTPMGLGVLAFSTDGDLEQARSRFGGVAVAWDQLPALRREAVMGERPGAAGAAPSAPQR